MTRIIYEIVELIAYTQNSPLNVRADVFSGDRGLKFGLSLHLHQLIVHAISEAPACLSICIDLPEPSLIANAVSNIFLVLAHF